MVWPIPALAQSSDPVSSALAQKAQRKGKVRILVSLKDDVSRPANLSSSQGMAQRAQQVHGLQDRVLNELSASGYSHLKRFKYESGMAMEVDSATLQQLQADPRVESVQEDVADRAFLSGSVPLIGGDVVFAEGYDGTGWATAILDTGVETGHAFFGGRVVSEACYSTNSGATISSVCPGGVEVSTAVGSGAECNDDDLTLPDSECDHGTHVAGIAAGFQSPTFSGVGRAADIIAIQVFSKFSSAGDCFPFPAPCVLSFRSDQIMGLERVLTLSASMDIASANMSLGGSAFTSQAACDLSNPLQKAAIDNLRAAGIATVIASGNNGFSDRISSPGCLSSAVSVGSTTKSDVVSSFSNTASFLDLMAPGSSINSSILNGNFGFKSGTSMATPHVAGAWAVLKQAANDNGESDSVDDLLAILKSTGVSVTDPGNGLSFPRIQLDAAVDEVDGGPITIVTAPSGAPNPVEPEGNVAVTVDATEEGSNPLNFDWSADCSGWSPDDGSFNDHTLEDPTWTAPDNVTGSAQDCQIQVTIDNGVLGDSIQADYTQQVNSVPQEITITAGPDGTPNPASSSQMVSMTVSATDLFGRVLNFDWSVDCSAWGGANGTFDDANVQNPTWHPPANLTGSIQDCDVTVEVDDGFGNSNSGGYTQQVNETNHTLTINAGPDGSPNPVTSEGDVNLTVTAVDTFAHTINYLWSVDCGTLGDDGSLSNATVQNPTWTAPANPGTLPHDCTITVDVDDGQGLNDSGSYTQTILGESLGLVYNDVDGDGKSDLLFRDNNNGEHVALYMDGLVFSSGASFLDLGPASPWEIVGVGDFDDDGVHDILLLQPITREVAILFIQNPGSPIAEMVPVLLPSDQEIFGSGDFDGDGKWDFMTYNTVTGDIAVTFLDGSSIVSTDPLLTLPPASNWVPENLGDFNGDKKSDIAFYNTVTGEVSIVLVDGTTITPGATAAFSELPATGWVVAHVGDLDGDGKSDIVLQNTITGDFDVLFMDGTVSTSQVNLLNLDPADGWEAVDTGDTDGNGTADLVFFNNVTGEVAIILVDGSTLMDSANVVTIPPGSGWFLTIDN